jgi:Glycosyltransferase
MTGWLVNDQLSTIPGTTTFWHRLLNAIPGLIDKTTGTYAGLAEVIEAEAAVNPPDYIIRNAAFFRALDVPCPVISLVQDILGPYHLPFVRPNLIESCCASRLVVFNTEYTRSEYPELANASYRIIPIGVDPSIFKPGPVDPEIPSDAVLWVGSGHRVKGFDLARKLAAESARPWIFVMKDEAEVPEAALVFRSINQDHLALLARSCAVGVCTSQQETQHLAGIEMGLCGLPLVTTNVGVYHARPAGAWGEVVDRDWHSVIDDVAGLPRGEVSRYWLDEGFGLDNCMSMWRTTVQSLEVEHVGR